MKKKPIIDPRGQWAYPGRDTIIPTASGGITMQGVPYPVYGQDETGYGQMMYPGGEYQFPGKMVYETPMMAGGGQHGGLDRWFAEKWVDVKTGKTCGRQKGEKRKGYPACRPSRRVSEDTPKTASELSSSEREKFKRSKTSSQRINYQHRRKEDGGEINEQDMANKPNNPALWSRAKSLAKQKFDVYPSAYANGWAAKWYKGKGGTWRKAEYGMEVPMFQKGGGGSKKPKETNPYKEVMSRGADFFRSLLPVPDNVAQLAAKQLLGDARMSNSSLDDRQKVLLWDVIQNAKKRTGKSNSGTEYQDYGSLGYGSPEDYHNWFNRGKLGLGNLITNSLSNDGFKLASTIGRGRYWTDEADPETIYYTDVYDWNPNEKNYKGVNPYQNLRNYVRGTEDKNLNADKNEMYRMNFKLNKKEIDKLRKAQQMRDEVTLGMGMFQVGGEEPVGMAAPKPMTFGLPKYKPLPLGLNFGLDQNNLYNLNYNITASGKSADNKFSIVDPRQQVSLSLLEGLIGKGRNVNISGIKGKNYLDLGLKGSTPLLGGNLSVSGNYNYVNQAKSPSMQEEEASANFMRTPQRKSNFGVNAQWEGKPFGEKGPNTKIGFTVGNSRDGMMKYGGTDNPGFKALPEYVQAKILSNMAEGGEPQNAGFQALPEYVQAKILDNMAYGGMAYPFMEEGGEPNGEMAMGQMAAVSDKMAKLLQFVKPEDNLDPWIASKLAVMDHSADAISDYMMYGAEGDEEEMEEEMPEMKSGGGIPERYKNMGFTKVGVKKNSTRPGKKWMVLAKKGDQYKVVHGGYDGMKDFSQHGSEKRKANFWNRMGGKNSSKATDPFSPLYWHKKFGTWEEGGEVDGEYEMKKGGSILSGNAWYQFGGMLKDTTQVKVADTTKKPNPVQTKFVRTIGFSPTDTAKMQQMIPQFNSAKEKLQQRIKEKQYAQGGIHLDPAKKGTFKAQATRMGMGVQEAAAAILNAPEGKYSPEMRRKANFARNFAKQMGGLVEGAEIEVTPEQAELLRQQGYDFEII